MPINYEPINDPDLIAERVLDLERQNSSLRKSALTKPDPWSAPGMGTTPTLGSGAGGADVKLSVDHDMGGPNSPHLGILYNAQGPQFALLDGSRNYRGHFIPNMPDVYDLGEKLLPWRSLHVSEIRSTIFHRYEQFLISGIYSVVHGSGKFSSDVTAIATQIDFGQTMTALDIVVIRTDNNGSPQVEYMEIGSQVSGTIYNVTRNLDGSGANAWPIGTVYMIQGTTGDGWIDFDAVDSPRMSLIKKTGPLWNDYAEMIRIGDLDGGWGINESVWGAAFGQYTDGQPHLLIEPGALSIRNRILGVNYDVIKLTGSGASFDSMITLGINGGIRQGSGTWGTDFTGSALWNENDIMNIGGWNAGIKQWWGGSDGALHANTGLTSIGATGILLNSVIGGGTGNLRFQVHGFDTVLTEQIHQITTFTFASGLTFTALYADEAFPSAQGYTYAGPRLSFLVNDWTDTISASMSLEPSLVFLGFPAANNISLNKTDNKITYTASGGHTFVGAITAGSLKISSLKGVGQTIANDYGNYLHLGAWGVARTAANAVLVNTAYMADNADLLDGYHASSMYRTDFPQVSFTANGGSTEQGDLMTNNITMSNGYDASFYMPNYGVPAGSKFALLRVGCKFLRNPVSGYDTLSIHPGSTTRADIYVPPMPTGVYGGCCQLCRINGDYIRVTCNAGAGLSNVTIAVIGYVR